MTEHTRPPQNLHGRPRSGSLGIYSWFCIALAYKGSEFILKWIALGCIHASEAAAGEVTLQGLGRSQLESAFQQPLQKVLASQSPAVPCQDASTYAKQRQLHSSQQPAWTMLPNLGDRQALRWAPALQEQETHTQKHAGKESPQAFASKYPTADCCTTPCSCCTQEQHL